MGQALADSIPMLVISSVNRRDTLGRGQGRLHELSSQQQLMAGVARSAAVMSARCFTSATSTSITMSKKSIERLTMRRLEMLPSCRAITVERLESDPG